MRKLIIIILSLACFIGVAQEDYYVSYQQANSDTDPITSLPLLFAYMPSSIDPDASSDGDTVSGSNAWEDVSGNGFDVTASGTFSLGVDAYGRYMDWDASGWFDVPDDTLLDVDPETDDFTVIWQFGPTIPRSGYMISKAPATSSQRVFGEWISGSEATKGYYGTLYFGGATTTLTPTDAIANQLAIVVCDSGVLNMWVDGVQVVTNLNSGTTATLTGQSWNIGSRSDGGFPAGSEFTMRMAVLIDKAIDSAERADIETVYQIN